MPNRYEREIEEIMRNLEQTDPKPGVSQKFGERFQRKPGAKMRTRQPRLLARNFTLTDRLLVIAVIAALIGGGYEYIVEANIFTLILAVIGVACLIVVALSQFLFQRRAPRSVRYGNVTITPLRRTPFGMVKTQWNLFKLKLRYRRKKNQ